MLGLDSSRLSRAAVIGLAVLLAGCARSLTPSAPAPPQPPSLPLPPQTQTGSASATKAETQGEKQSEAGEKAEGKAKAEARSQGQAGDTAEMNGATSKSVSGSRAGGTQGQGKHATGGERSGVAGETGAVAGGPGALGANTPDEHKDVLDGKLQASMAEFDGMLLREQKALEEKQRKDPLPERGGEAGGGGAGTEGSGEGSSDSGSGKAGAGKAGSAGPKDDRTPGERRAAAEAEAEAARQKGKAGDKGSTGASTTDTGTGGSTDAGPREDGATVTAPVEGGPAGPGSDSRAVPEDVGDGRNDDVVARQLREAAMKEKDPAIRAKLWDEYREYKKSAGKGGI